MFGRAALLLLALVVVGSHAAAEEKAEPVHPLTNIPGPGEVSTGFYFPEHTTKRLPAGEAIKVMVALHNDGEGEYNVTHIMGSLNSPQDFSMHIQNFTAQEFNIPVKGGEEVSLEYKFKPDYRLEPREFTVALTVFYQDSKGAQMATTFFNQTIGIVEVKKLVDFEMIFLFIMLGGIFTAIGWLVWQSLGPQLTSMGLMKKNKKTKRAVVTDADAAANDDDWVKGTNYDNFVKKKAATVQKRK